MLGQPADRDAIHTVFGDGAQPGQVDATGHLQRDPRRDAGSDTHRFAARGGVEVVNQDAVATFAQRLFQLRQRFHFDDQGQGGIAIARGVDRAGDEIAFDTLRFRLVSSEPLEVRAVQVAGSGPRRRRAWPWLMLAVALAALALYAGVADIASLSGLTI